MAPTRYRVSQYTSRCVSTLKYGTSITVPLNSVHVRTYTIHKYLVYLYNHSEYFPTCSTAGILAVAAEVTTTGVEGPVHLVTANSCPSLIRSFLMPNLDKNVQNVQYLNWSHIFCTPFLDLKVIQLYTPAIQ